MKYLVESYKIAVEMFVLSEELVLARIDEDWEKVVAVARRLSYLSGMSRLIEPYWGNPSTFFAMEVLA